MYIPKTEILKKGLYRIGRDRTNYTSFIFVNSKSEMWVVLDSNYPSAGGLPCQGNALNLLESHRDELTTLLKLGQK